MATEIVYIIDKSGSMGNLIADVVGGFNTFLIEQQKPTDEAFLTTILFDTNFRVFQDKVNIKEAGILTAQDYVPSGSTALLDAVGRAITIVKNREEKCEKVLFLIMTDGEENSSHEYSLSEIKAMVESCRAEGWEFVFTGANIDSFAEAGKMGMTLSGNYTADPDGVTSVYTSAGIITRQYRGGGQSAIDSSQLTKLS